MNYLLTGLPGVGKTTLIRKVIEKLDRPAGGFFTQEIREGKKRTGFYISTLSGVKGILANVNLTSRYQVGKYKVAVDTFERIGVKAIEDAITENKLVIIDEIGKMELFSKAFKRSVIKALDLPNPVLGTIIFTKHPFADKIKQRDDVKIFEVTRENRDELMQTLLEELKD